LKFDPNQVIFFIKIMFFLSKKEFVLIRINPSNLWSDLELVDLKLILITMVLRDYAYKFFFM